VRIISGEFGGRRLKAVPGQNTRPTTDKIKESLFNILGGYFDGGVMLDMYSGSGAVAIEAVSRGMDRAFLFENNRLAQKTIEQNIEITKSPEQFHLKRQNVKQGLKIIASDPAFELFELVFMDPPYRLQEIVKDIEQLQELNLLSSDSVIVCEVDKEVQLPERILEFEQYKRVEYGITALVFFDRATSEEEA
jgi:RNA methyltransferase, rsmD family